MTKHTVGMVINLDLHKKEMRNAITKYRPANKM